MLSFVIPRGLATAVLAGLPFAAGLDFARDYTAFALGVIVLSNLVTTVGVVLFAQTAARRVRVEGGAGEQGEIAATPPDA